MQSITSNHGVHVHADLNELTRIRHQLTASQLALWGDHSSKIAAMFGLANNDIADLIFNDCGLVVWAVENPELGIAVAAGLTAIWAQLANLNALCDLVESRYQVGELTIDRKMALEHQLLEVAATAPFFAKLNLGWPTDKDDFKRTPIHRPIVGMVCEPLPLPISTPVHPPTTGHSPTPVHPPRVEPVPIIGGGSGRGSTSANALTAPRVAAELQDSEQPQGAAGYKSSSTEN
jgi:hypothetical protein